MRQSKDNLDVVYEQAYRQTAEQSDEIERIDRKATALLTPIGLLIGLAINVGVRKAHQVNLSQVVFFGGLLVLLLAMFAGIMVLWPRQFRRVAPAVPVELDHGRPRPNWWTTIVGLRAALPPRRYVGQWEQLQFAPPDWWQDSAEDTARDLIERLTAAWRINSVLLGPKSRWLNAQFVLMLVGAALLAGWYVLPHS